MLSFLAFSRIESLSNDFSTSCHQDQLEQYTDKELINIYMRELFHSLLLYYANS